MKKRKSREKREMLGQFTVRFYKDNPVDELIFETLDPLAQGLLRATLIEALRMGIQSLKKQGWPFLTDVAVEKKTGKIQQDEVPASVQTNNQNQQQAMTALQELFLDN